MSAAFLKRLAASLGVLVVIWLGLMMIRGGGRDRPEGFHAARFDTTAVTAVTIETSGDTMLTLTRGPAGWTVNGWPAAPHLISGLLADLTDTLATGDLIAESASSHARLGVDSATGKRITVRAGNQEILRYWFGKRGSTWDKVYVRDAGETQVYEVRTRLGEALDRRADDWRDKRVLAVAVDSIGAVEVRRGRLSYTLERAGTGWSLRGAPADSAAVAGWLSRFAEVSASGFPTPAQADSANFSRPDRAIAIRGRAGQVLANLAFDSTASGFLVRRVGQPTIYRLDI